MYYRKIDLRDHYHPPHPTPSWMTSPFVQLLLFLLSLSHNKCTTLDRRHIGGLHTCSCWCRWSTLDRLLLLQQLHLDGILGTLSRLALDGQTGQRIDDLGRGRLHIGLGLEVVHVARVALHHDPARVALSLAQRLLNVACP